MLCKLNKVIGDPCGARINSGTSTTNMRAHPTNSHGAWLANHFAAKADAQQPLVATDVTVEVGPAWSAEKRHHAVRKLSYWLVLKQLPPHLVKDKEFQDLCAELSNTKFTPACPKTVNSHVVKMAAAGLKHGQVVMSHLKEEGVNLSMASDIWSDSTVSLMGTCLYYIDANWEGLHEVLIGCIGFTGERHTGEHIKKQTANDPDSVGLTFGDIHAKVSDQGSNVKKAWGGLPGGFCAAYTLELATKVFLTAVGVAALLGKAEGDEHVFLPECSSP